MTLKIPKNVVVICLFFICLSNCSLYSVRAESFYSRSFEWYYDGYVWAWTLNVPASQYHQYTRIGVDERFIYGYECWDYLVTTENDFLIKMAGILHNASQSMAYSRYNEANFILAFVQSLPYTSDSITTGYDDFPRFPIETLIDGGGDCEDTSILFATLLLILGYNLVFLSPTAHLAVGIREESDLTCNGIYFEDRQSKYFYCETTGESFKIGDFPLEFENNNVKIIDIRPIWQYRPVVRFVLLPIFIGVLIVGGVTIGIIVYYRKHHPRQRIRTFPQRYSNITPPHPLNAKCYVESCNKEVLMPFVCKRCGECFCPTHRLPENHDCVEFLQRYTKNST